MRSICTFICTSLLTTAALFAQMGPPHGFGGPGGPGFGGEGFGGPGFGRPGGPPVSGAPYSATITETHQNTLADGNAIQQTRTEKVYRDNDGRTRVESTFTTPSGTTRTNITIFDPVAGFVAHLNPSEATAVKATLPAPPSGTAPTPPTPPADLNRPQPVKTDLGTSTVAGVPANGTKTTVTIPAGSIGNAQPIVITREVWVSTALKVPVQITSADPTRGNETMAMSNISQGAQDPTLFQIPSNYTVKDAPNHHRPGADGPPPPPDGVL